MNYITKKSIKLLNEMVKKSKDTDETNINSDYIIKGDLFNEICNFLDNNEWI